MYETDRPLDFSGILWYHKRVKLGCYATVPHGFDRLISRPKQGFPAPAKGDGNGEFLFRIWRSRLNSACPASVCVSLFSAKSPPSGRAYLCTVRGAVARLPGGPMPADVQER